MYEAQTYEVILARMLQKALSVNSNLDTREGSLVWLGNAPAAVELQNLYIALDTVLNETFADTASRPYLIQRAGERGLSPQPASPAILQMAITPTTLFLPMNTRFSIGELNYTLLVKVGVAAKKNFQDVQTLLKRVAPVNLVLVVQQLFNIHQVLGGFTHAQLAWYTHSEVRTEELQTHECTPHKTLRPFTHAQLGGLENKSIRKEMTDGTVHT